MVISSVQSVRSTVRTAVYEVLPRCCVKSGGVWWGRVNLGAATWRPHTELSCVEAPTKHSSRVVPQSPSGPWKMIKEERRLLFKDYTSGFVLVVFRCTCFMISAANSFTHAVLVSVDFHSSCADVNSSFTTLRALGTQIWFIK